MFALANGLRRAFILICVATSALSLSGCGGGGGGSTLQSVEVTPANSQAAAGTSAPFAATAIFTDGSHRDVTAQAVWASASTIIATVSNTAPNQGLVSATSPGSTSISATYGGQTGSTGFTVTPAVLRSIDVTPAQPTVAKGQTQQFKATGTFSDGSTQDLTGQVTWASANPAVAAISNTAGSQGLASTLAMGSTAISAASGSISGGTTLTVTAANLVSVQVTPGNPNVAKGLSQQFTATGVFSDNSTQDLTSQASWASSNTGVATISNTAGSQGLASTGTMGATTISAISGGVTGSTTLTVTTAVLSSIQVTPTNPSVAKGLTKQFTATGVFSDGSTQDLTTQATWSSSNGSVATVSNAAGSNGLASTSATGATIVAATSGGVSGSTTLTVTAALLSSIQVTPTDPSVAKGLKQQFTATGTFSDNSTQDLTGQVTWASSTTAVATISNAAGSQGLATTLSTGTTTISAASGGISGNTSLTVTAATLRTIQVTPTNPSVAKGVSQPFTATGTYTDGTTQNLTSQVTWDSSNTTVASISNASGSKGLATTAATGTSTISATSGSVSGHTTLTVTAAMLNSIQVTPTNPTVAKGVSQPFTATGTYTDGTTQNLTSQVTWASSNTTVASISNASGSKGQAATLATGTTTISATSGSVSGSTTLTVTAATLVSIGVTPANPTIAKGTTQQFTATGVYTDNTTQDLTATATWSSSNSSVAPVSNASGSQGLAAGSNTGQVTITASSGSVTGSTGLTVSAASLVSIQVTSPASKVAVGFSLQFTATGIYTDNTTQDITQQVSWLSTDTSIATVVSDGSKSNGLATGVNAGSVTIVAQTQSGSGSTIQGSKSLTVSSATLSSISVTPPNYTLPNGRTLQYTATGTFSDNTTQDLTTQVSWTSSSTAVATVTSQGLAKAVAATGSTTITATSTANNKTVSGVATLTANSADLISVKVSPDTISVAKGVSQQFTAQGTFSDGNVNDVTKQVTWSSSQTSVATISNASPTQGLASSTGVGTTTITAQGSNASGAAVSGSSTLTVTAATLNSIAVTPATSSVAKGVQVQYKAVGTYSDQSTNDLTSQVTWASSDNAVALISNASGSQGLASTPGVGTATISATSGTVKNSATLTVTNATLSSITVTPTNPSIGAGSTQQFTATGNYSDNTTQPLTNQVTWSSSNTAVAVISNNGSSKGQAFAQAQGQTTITAVDPASSVSSSTTLTVTPAALQGITISPAPADTDNGKVPQGYKEQFLVIGHYADNSTQDLTSSATWNSFNPQVLSVSNDTGTKGLATGLATGSTTITAQVNQFSASKALTVSNATLSSITLSPATQTLNGPNKTQQYSAQGSFSDGSSLDLTAQISSWSSSNTSAATISNTGLATSQQVLTSTPVTISATQGGKTGTASLTVTPF